MTFKSCWLTKWVYPVAVPYVSMHTLYARVHVCSIVIRMTLLRVLSFGWSPVWSLWDWISEHVLWCRYLLNLLQKLNIRSPIISYTVSRRNSIIPYVHSLKFCVLLTYLNCLKSCNCFIKLLSVGFVCSTNPLTTFISLNTSNWNSLIQESQQILRTYFDGIYIYGNSECHRWDLYYDSVTSQWPFPHLYRYKVILQVFSSVGIIQYTFRLFNIECGNRK